ncbi:uncharacterized protein LOC122507084 [Leptopilina heterotoma]|uniref:uncharacterized protein LOC122507084 n=1 Tax=Leptopilina heterotoma TaxID=63436 RepID=UPI001CA8AE3A|nr:uncharacterized protein LOC122507084 [Leptopilina heterotoma]
METQTENNKLSPQDTYEYLKEVQREMQSEIDELTEAIKNNPSSSLNSNTTNENIVEKKLRFFESLKRLILMENPKNYLETESKDIYTTAVKNLQEEHQNMSTLLDNLNKELSRLKSDVSYYEDKISGYEKMKKAALNANEIESQVTYEEEYALVRRIFNSVKSDLSKTLDLIFPDNDEIINFLMHLSKKQLQGGDDVYEDINDENLKFVNFLNTLGIVVYHPHNSNKCKMANLL